MDVFPQSEGGSEQPGCSLTAQQSRGPQNWVHQCDGSSCGPLAVAAACALLQGRTPDRSFLGGNESVSSATAVLLRQSQMLDYMALLMAKHHVNWDEFKTKVKNEALRNLVETAVNRVFFLR